MTVASSSKFCPRPASASLSFRLASIHPSVPVQHARGSIFRIFIDQFIRVHLQNHAARLSQPPIQPLTSPTEPLSFVYFRNCPGREEDSVESLCKGGDLLLLIDGSAM
jgi:hypothetical protein